MAHRTEQELEKVGLKYYGENLKLSKDANIYSPHKIKIGNNVRIEDFVILSGEIEIGNNVYLAPGVQIAASSSKVLIKDFATFAFGTVVTASSDDYSGLSLTGPTVPDPYRKSRTVSEIMIGRHVIIGANSIILPGVSIGDGAAIGALSMVTRSLEAWGIYAGCPVRRIADRNKDLLHLEAELLAETSS